MSDDGYADDGFSTYSDFEDLLYDADPAPDLADDLASHAVHSPNFAEEPGFELGEYHSDWEYYSDDYYDDDPNLLKGNPQEGSPLKSHSQKPEKRGKKRKLADVGNIPELDLGERAMLKDCMRGTVWAEPPKIKDNIFRIGNEAKVSLLSDWKIRFGDISVQQLDKPTRSQFQQDESWANDLSLADMGLLNARGANLEQPANEDGDEEQDEDEQAEEEGTKDDYEESGVDEDIEAAIDDATGGFMDQAQLPDEVGKNSTTSSLPPHKKLRMSLDSLPPPPTSAEIRSMAENVPDEATQLEPPSNTPTRKRGRGRPRKAQVLEDSEDILEPLNGSTTAASPEENSKKRKASKSPPAEAESNGIRKNRAILNGRGKRIASAAAAPSGELSDGMQKTAASTKPTRSKKR